MRTICEKCKKPATYTPEQFHLLGLDPKDFEGGTLMKGEGCPACNKTGYKGRSGIYELMVMSPELRNMLMKHADTNDLRTQALKEGMSTLRMSAFRKAKRGLSTLEEVQRVTLE
jgi:type IV pilus assembly protein PilB